MLWFILLLCVSVLCSFSLLVISSLLEPTTACLSLHTLMGIWVLSSFSVWQTGLLWISTFKFSYRRVFFYLLGTQIGMKWLCHMLGTYLTFQETAKLVKSDYTFLPSGQWCESHRHLMQSGGRLFFLIVVIPVCRQQCVLVVWFAFPSWSSGGVHVLMCLFVIHVSSLLKCPFRHCPFFDWVLLLLSFRSSLYILSTGSLSHTFFAEFFQSSRGLSFHILFTLSFGRAVLKFDGV